MNKPKKRLQTVRAIMPSPLCCFKRTEVVGKPRAYPGGLLVTRAFGNFHSKVRSCGNTRNDRRHGSVGT